MDFAAFLAHLALFGRHRRTVVVCGLHWRYCVHRSHRRRRLSCWRWAVYDGYCAQHNESCYTECPTEETP